MMNSSSSIIILLGIVTVAYLGASSVRGENRLLLEDIKEHIEKAKIQYDRLAIDANGMYCLELSELEITDVSPLRNLPLDTLSLGGTGVSNISPLAGMRLKSLALYGTQVRDLSPLRGMPIVWLSLSDTPIKDISPLKSMPLDTLFVGAEVEDFSPLAGMKLRHLYIQGTGKLDLTFLKEMPLKRLGLDKKEPKDFSPLKGMELISITFAWPGETRNMEVLKEMSTLKRINRLPANEFWAGLESSINRAKLNP